MKKVIFALFILGVGSMFAAGQAANDIKKVEVFAGFSHSQVDTDNLYADSPDRVGFNGFNGSAVYNLNRYFGVKADVSGAYGSNKFTGNFDLGGTPYIVNVDSDNSLYNFLGGVQVKDNARSGRLKPFAHALIGAAHGRSKITNFSCSPSTVCAGVILPDEASSETGWAGAFGGGLDVRLNNKIQIRAFQVDYNPTRLDASTQHNVRFSTGIVF